MGRTLAAGDGSSCVASRMTQQPSALASAPALTANAASATQGWCQRPRQHHQPRRHLPAICRRPLRHEGCVPCWHQEATPEASHGDHTSGRAPLGTSRSVAADLVVSCAGACPPRGRIVSVPPTHTHPHTRARTHRSASAAADTFVARDLGLRGLRPWCLRLWGGKASGFAAFLGVSAGTSGGNSGSIAVRMRSRASWWCSRSATPGLELISISQTWGRRVSDASQTCNTRRRRP